MKRILTFALALIVVLSLAACGAEEVPVETTAAPTTVATTAPTTAPTTEATTEATEPVRQNLNPLNGSDQPMNHRAVAVMFNNIAAALPQHGTSYADVIVEVLADNCAVTRLVGVFSDIEQAQELGSLRSARAYTFSTARSFDAIYVHAGGSTEADELIADTDWDEINGIYYDGSYFYRNQDRINAGYSYEHTMFTTSELLREYIEKFDVRYEQETAPDYGFLFDDEKAEGEAANIIDIDFGFHPKKTHLEYDAETNAYFAYEYDQNFHDGSNDTDLSFRNAIVLKTDVWVQDDGVHLTYDLITNGEGVLFRDGVKQDILWYRESQDDSFHFTDLDGNPLSLGVGKTYIGITSLSGTVTTE